MVTVESSTYPGTIAMRSDSGSRNIRFVIIAVCGIAIFVYLVFGGGVSACGSLPREMQAPPTTDPFWGGINYNLISPNGSYIAAVRRAGSHGCESTTIYDCRAREQLYRLGCVGDIFPPESRHEVFPVEWVSNTELRISYYDESSSGFRETVVDVTNPDFSFLGQYWRTLDE
jgi:hypothetical protein